MRGAPTRVAHALRDQDDSQIEELHAEVAAYEALRRGAVGRLDLGSLDALPDALIRRAPPSGCPRRRWPRASA